MNAFENALKTFEELVPHGDESFMVLKAQLLVEHSVGLYVAARVPSMAKEIADRNSPVRSGLALILLAEAVSLRDQVKPAHSDILWPALKVLNSLRNDLAHSLYPKTGKVVERMKEFVLIVTGDLIKSSENLNQLFRTSAMLVVGFLELDREPFTPADCE